MRIRYAPLAVACAIMVAGAAQAASVTYNFGGTLDSVDGTITFLSVGDSFTGSFTFDSTSPNTYVGPAQAVYPEGFSITTKVHGYSFFSNSNPSNCPGCGNVTVVNDAAVGDLFIARNESDPVSGPHPNGFTLYDLSVNLYDFTGVAFNSNALPSNLALSAFDYHRLGLSFLDAGGNGRGAGGEITSLSLATAAPVPEASSSAMLALGLGALGIAARRRKAA